MVPRTYSSISSLRDPSSYRVYPRMSFSSIIPLSVDRAGVTVSLPSPLLPSLVKAYPHKRVLNPNITKT